MRVNVICQFMVLLVLFQSFLSCSDDENLIETQPLLIEADNKWVEDHIVHDQELWYKVSCDASSTTAYLEWAEKGAHGEDRHYTGDIKVSAYQLDGATPYLEAKDHGYGEKARSFSLANNETDFLVKVITEETERSGSFAIRARAVSNVTLDYKDLLIQDQWADSIVATDEVIGYRIKYTGEKKLGVVWAETDTPEQGYTADIVVSVLHADGTTPYKDVEKKKDFVDKNKSHSNDPKYIITDANETKFKIHIKSTMPGTFALKVFEVE